MVPKSAPRNQPIAVGRGQPLDYEMVLNLGCLCHDTQICASGVSAGKPLHAVSSPTSPPPKMLRIRTTAGQETMLHLELMYCPTPVAQHRGFDYAQHGGGNLHNLDVLCTRPQAARTCPSRVGLLQQLWRKRLLLLTSTRAVVIAASTAAEPLVAAADLG